MSSTRGEGWKEHELGNIYNFGRNSGDNWCISIDTKSTSRNIVMTLGVAGWSVTCQGAQRLRNKSCVLLRTSALLDRKSCHVGFCAAILLTILRRCR